MSTPKILTAFATILAALGTLVLFVQDSSFAQDAGPYGPAGKRPFLRRDSYYNAWYYDGRDDQRDFPTNGFFPGDFAADPAHAAIGAAGGLEPVAGVVDEVFGADGVGGMALPGAGGTPSP